MMGENEKIKNEPCYGLTPLTKKQLGFLRRYGEMQQSKEFYYVTVHPLADEKEILDRLRLSPDKCTICDLYWALGKRIAFVTIHGDPSIVPSAAYRTEKKDYDVPYRFVISTNLVPLTRPAVERGLSWLAHWFGSKSARSLQGAIDLTGISDADILLP